jgi:hypothetical protein
MPARSDDPLRRVTLNLYEADCTALAKHLGQGWTTEVREAVHAYALRIGAHRKPLTLGDLNDILD